MVLYSYSSPQHRSMVGCGLTVCLHFFHKRTFYEIVVRAWRLRGSGPFWREGDCIAFSQVSISHPPRPHRESGDWIDLNDIPLYHISILLSIRLSVYDEINKLKKVNRQKWINRINKSIYILHEVFSICFSRIPRKHHQQPELELNFVAIPVDAADRATAYSWGT